MGVRKIGGRLYVYFNWKGNRLQTVTSALNEAEAKRIERSVKTAFNIYRFDHLEPKALEVTIKIFETKGWKLPDELATPEPEKELTLFQGIKDYLDAAERNRTVRKVFAIDRIEDYFGENTPLENITVLSVRKYRDHRLTQGVTNGTVNIEVKSGPLESSRVFICAGKRALHIVRKCSTHADNILKVWIDD